MIADAGLGCEFVPYQKPAGVWICASPNPLSCSVHSSCTSFLPIVDSAERVRMDALTGLTPHSGFVSVVAGSGGKTQAGAGLTHPVHRRFNSTLGGR
jgi:hypothetical protein